MGAIGGAGCGLRPSVTGVEVVDPPAGSASPPTTSIRVISGAASSMARSTASSSVTDDEEQPSQLPSIRSSTTPSSPSMERISTSPPWEPR